MAGPQDLTEIQERLRRFRDDRDWQQFHTLKDLAAAIAIEASELQEIFLWNRDDAEQELAAARRKEISDELADVLIQCLNFALAAEIDVLEAVASKIDKNEVRYTVERARGSARKSP
jgi:NTP pyrophosphatase (non-canonical NTP hydrolase)